MAETIFQMQHLVPHYAVISAATSGQTAVVAAVTGRKIRVLQYFVVAETAVDVKFESASTAITGLMSIGANSGVAAGSEAGIFETVAAEALNINLGGAVQVSGALTYVLI